MPLGQKSKKFGLVKQFDGDDKIESIYRSDQGDVGVGCQSVAARTSMIIKIAEYSAYPDDFLLAQLMFLSVRFQRK